MGSRNHTSGVGFEPRLLGQRSLGAVLAGQRQSGADNRFAIYVRPLGNGFHEVKNLCNDTPYKVGSAVASATFKPGAEVLLGSNAGTPGEVIIGLGPPGRRGGSEFSLQAQVRSFRMGVKAQSVCPVPITGKHYLGLVEDGDLWRALLYLDGTYQEELGSVDMSGVPNVAGVPELQRVHPLGDVILYKGHQSLRDWVVTVDFGASTAVALDLTDDLTDPSAPVWAGGTAYVYLVDARISAYQLDRVELGASGVLDEPAARYGVLYAPDETNLGTSSILCASGADFNIPSIWLEDDSTRFPWYDGAWHDGIGRVPAGQGPTPLSCGFPCLSNTHSIRHVFVGEEDFPNVALLPAGGGSPEVPLLPTDWDLTPLGSMSVSPNGSEVAIFDIRTGTDQPEDGPFLYRTKIQAQQYPQGCELARITVQASPWGLPFQMFCRD